MIMMMVMSRRSSSREEEEERQQYKHLDLMMMMRMGSNANEQASKQRWKESVAVAMSRSFACCLAAPHTPSLPPTSSSSSCCSCEVPLLSHTSLPLFPIIFQASLNRVIRTHTKQSTNTHRARDRDWNDWSSRSSRHRCLIGWFTNNINIINNNVMVQPTSS